MAGGGWPHRLPCLILPCADAIPLRQRPRRPNMALPVLQMRPWPGGERERKRERTHHYHHYYLLNYYKNPLDRLCNALHTTSPLLLQRVPCHTQHQQQPRIYPGSSPNSYLNKPSIPSQPPGILNARLAHKPPSLSLGFPAPFATHTTEQHCRHMLSFTCS
jgi:hypothetical protein